MTAAMHRTQSFITAAVMAAASLFMSSSPCSAQDAGSRAEEQAREQEKKARAASTYRPPWLERQLLGIEQAGGFGVARGVVVAFGDIKRGSGIALGPAYGKTFASGATLWTKAVYSISNYKLLQAAFASAPMAHDRLWVRGRARWQDAPSGLVYPLGPDAPEQHGNYAETRTEVSGAATVRPQRFVRLEAGTGVERYRTDVPFVQGGGAIPPLVQGLPGAGTDPRYVHSFASAAIDARDAPGYSRRGTLLQGTLHDYHDRGGAQSFQRVDGVAEQYLPILQGNWVLFFRLRASTTSTSGNNVVPFFLMPDLGGADLRGFANYRFRDRHAILGTVEYRWYAQEYLEGAIFYDAGKAVPDRRSLDFSGLKSSVGAGIRFHTPQTTVLRLEVARSREGTRLILAFSPVGG
jgi:surface antigen Omp85-like protein